MTHRYSISDAVNIRSGLHFLVAFLAAQFRLDQLGTQKTLRIRCDVKWASETGPADERAEHNASAASRPQRLVPNHVRASDYLC